MEITSLNNEIVKNTAKLLQRKFRDESGLFILEGDKCIEEALFCGIEIEKLFVIQGYNKFNNIDRIETTEAVLSKISSTTTPPKAVAVAKQIKREWNTNYNKVALLENIKDAGNLGTILRCAAAFDISAVILYGDTVDLYNPKCVRSSVGNLWKVPVFQVKNFDELKKYTANLIPIATLPKSENSIWLKDFVPKKNMLIMFGAESTGLSDELKNYAKQNITIEMSDGVESLNLSISAGVVFYKFMI